MSYTVLTKSFAPPPFCEKEILRYAGCRDTDSGVAELLHSCIKEVQSKLTYKVCYSVFPVSIQGEVCDMGAFCVHSKNLATNLDGCESVVIFAATVGVETDRLITKYGSLSPSRALMIQAIGAERIEALCDTFCKDIENEYCASLKPRFSPGYGDLPLETQKDIFGILGCNKRIGLTLSNSLIMLPTKSVTAFMGIYKGDL